jgi:hypothetical protein
MGLASGHTDVKGDIFFISNIELANSVSVVVKDRALINPTTPYTAS